MNQTFILVVLTSLLAAKLICAAGIYDLDMGNTTSQTTTLSTLSTSPGPGSYALVLTLSSPLEIIGGIFCVVLF